MQQQLEADGEFEEDPDSNDGPVAENTHSDSENGNDVSQAGEAGPDTN